MTPEHFREVLYCITLTTQSNKKDICKYLNISRVSLNKWLREGIPEKRKFLVLDQLEVYLFSKLGERYVTSHQ
jgi:hypothetical protein